MRDPSIDKLLEKVPSKYKLVYVASQRAKQIAEGDCAMGTYNSKKAVGKALEEILSDKVAIKG